MKLLVLTGPLFPQPGNNANLMGKLIRCFTEAGVEVQLFSGAFGENGTALPKTMFRVPVVWVNDSRRDWKRKVLYPLISKITDYNGYSDAIQVLIMRRELNALLNREAYDAVLATSEPFSMACLTMQAKNVKKALYMMDPPVLVGKGFLGGYRVRCLRKILGRLNTLITTPFIAKAIESCGFRLSDNTVTVGFPMISKNLKERKAGSEAKIRLLFCGWLYSRIRSPEFFLSIVSRLDERFEVTFMGRECEKLRERFPIETKATLITLPNQPYDVALQAMADADILINIGNSVPVHMPSKTLEYINTGKPMVNFYKFADCPTLYYTKRYPLALNLFEEEKDVDAAVARFVQFCEKTIGKTVVHDRIEAEYADCTPRYIAQIILESLEKSHG